LATSRSFGASWIETRIRVGSRTGRGFAVYLGLRLFEQATLVQEVTVRLADLDQVPVGIV